MDMVEEGGPGDRPRSEDAFKTQLGRPRFLFTFNEVAKVIEFYANFCRKIPNCLNNEARAQPRVRQNLSRCINGNLGSRLTV